MDADRFQILGELGAGSAGTVFEAFDTALASVVAVKTLCSFDAAAVLDLKRELSIRAELDHEHLVHLHELVVHPGGDALLVMERVEGVSIVDHVQAHRDDLESIARQLLRAIATLHAAGILHRDIKPSNLLVAKGPRLVVVDLGLARELSAAAAHAPAGTLRYMAPEQLLGHATGEAADAYSVGLCLFEAAAGRPPFTASGQDLVFAKTIGVAPRVETLASTITPELACVIDSLLAREPRDRPTMAEALEQLEHLGPSALRAHGFVGRRAELAELQSALERASSGSTEVIRVSGDSGLGKTTLVSHFLSGTPPDAVVLRGRCQPLATRPYAALDECIDELARWLARQAAGSRSRFVPKDGAAVLLDAFPVLSLVDTLRGAASSEGLAHGRREIAHLCKALSDVFVEIRAKHTVLLWIDDAQWADADSMPLLRSLLSAGDAPRGMMLMLSHRPLATFDDEGALLARSLPSTGSTELALSPFDALDMRAFIESRNGDIPPERNALLDESEGNPLFLSELSRHTLSPDGSTGLLHLIAERVARVPESTREMLELLCVADAPLSRAVLLALMRNGEPWPAIRALCEADLARRTRVGGMLGVEPFHAKVRDAVLGRLHPQQLRALHERLLIAGQSGHVQSPSYMLPHLIALGRTAEAMRCAVGAAEQAERALAFDRAAQLYEEAIRLGGEPRATIGLRIKRGENLAQAGRGRGAAHELLSAALALDDQAGAEAIDLRTRAGEQLLRSGNFQEGLDTMRDALALVGVSLPRGAASALLDALLQRGRLFLERKRLFSEGPLHDADGASRTTRLDALWRAASALSLVEPVLSNALGTRHLVECLGRSDRRRQSHALGLEAGIRASLGGPRSGDEAQRLLARAASYLETCGDGFELGLLRICQATVAHFEYRFRDVVRLTREALDLFGSSVHGATWEMAHAFSFHLTALAYVGELDSLRRERRRALAWADARDDRFLSTGLRLGMPILAELADGNAEACIADAHVAMTPWPKRPFNLFHYLEVLATCMSELALGRPERAWTCIHDRWTDLSRAGYTRLPFTLVELTFLRARVAVSLPPDTRVPVAREVSRARATLARTGMPQAGAFASVLEAALSCRQGKREPAKVHWQSAIERFETLDLGGYRDAARALAASDHGGTEPPAWAAALLVRKPRDQRNFVAIGTGVSAP